MISGLYSNLNIWLRWIHVLAAIIWIGHLYFIDFVCTPLQLEFVASEIKPFTRQLMHRVFWWFRWGAMISLLSGLLLFTLNYMYIPGVGFGPTPLFADNHGFTDRAIWILFGMAIAGVMWFNVWFVIWPAQKRLAMAGNSSSQLDATLARRSFAAVRTNTFLSGPMLFAMLAPSHYGSISISMGLLVLGATMLTISVLDRFSRWMGARR
jgi:uncharacterized membrane protein